MASPSEVAAVVVELAGARRATLGGSRLVAVDGPGGSGKSTLAAALTARTGATVVHMDDLYDGWDGLRHVDDQLAALLLPLAEGRPGCYRRYDWHRRELAETVTVEPSAWLVVEGVASGATRFAGLVTALVWVWVDPALRLERGLARDGEQLRADWVRWMADEERLFAVERTAARADVVVDGTGAAAPLVQ